MRCCGDPASLLPDAAVTDYQPLTTVTRELAFTSSKPGAVSREGVGWPAYDSRFTVAGIASKKARA